MADCWRSIQKWINLSCKHSIRLGGCSRKIRPSCFFPARSCAICILSTFICRPLIPAFLYIFKWWHSARYKQSYPPCGIPCDETRVEIVSSPSGSSWGWEDSPLRPPCPGGSCIWPPSHCYSLAGLSWTSCSRCASSGPPSSAGWTLSWSCPCHLKVGVW